jgi:hypothetical protein
MQLPQHKQLAPWEAEMAGLDVTGAFIITLGHDKGPETWVAISASYEDGKPYQFPEKPDEFPATIFVALSA